MKKKEKNTKAKMKKETDIFIPVLFNIFF